MRRVFDKQLEELEQTMIAMGSMIEEAIDKACQALLDDNTELARSVMEKDVAVDQKEREIEGMCLRLLLKQQPIANDLRKVSSALKMITDMERVGDQAADISEIVTMQSGMNAVLSKQLMQRMAQETAKMVHSAIDAYVADDVDLAREVMATDDVVDDLFTQIKQELIQHLSRDASLGQQALDLLMIAKYYERIGDHAVNIGEWVEFSVTGMYKGEELQ
ncbi:MAG: phosphate signaling complex protein PhoU [Eubacteriales bacterium]|nr:phosphate signaling complex protein PhoU [Eubacteriales bacterium]